MIDFTEFDAMVDRMKSDLEEAAQDEIATVSCAILIANISFGATEDGSGDVGSTFFCSTTAHRFAQIGILHEGIRAVGVSSIPRETDDE